MMSYAYSLFSGGVHVTQIDLHIMTISHLASGSDHRLALEAVTIAFSTHILRS